jgi:hypothetical protein
MSHRLAHHRRPLNLTVLALPKARIADLRATTCNRTSRGEFLSLFAFFSIVRLVQYQPNIAAHVRSDGKELDIPGTSMSRPRITPAAFRRKKYENAKRTHRWRPNPRKQTTQMVQKRSQQKPRRNQTKVPEIGFPLSLKPHNNRVDLDSNASRTAHSRHKSASSDTIALEGGLLV